MNERWVCRRCFTSNDGNVGACTNCGLARGSEVPAGEEALPAAAPATSGRSGWSGLLRFAWIPIVIVVVAAGILFAARRDEGGQIVGAGNVDIFDLREGDCFDVEVPVEEEVETVEAKPCTEAHEFELYFVGSLPDGEYPDDATVFSFIEAECMPAFAEFVGVSYELSVLDIYYVVPDEDAWGAGERAAQCSVFEPLNEELTASMRGSRR